MPTKAEITRKIQHLQWAVLLIHIFVIGIGGCTFGLAVAARPILRISRHDRYQQMRSILDVMGATGMLQILISGFEIFAACWKLLKILYLAVALGGVMIILEIVSISTLSWVYLESDFIVSENVEFQPWVVWDCLPYGSCTTGMRYYVATYVAPQIGLAIISAVLLVFGIVFLIRLIRTLQEKQFNIKKARQLRRLANTEDPRSPVRVPEDAKSLVDDSDSSFGDTEDVDSNSMKSLASMKMNGDGQTYVQASGSSLDTDYDDVSVMRHRSKNKDPPSITFSGSVEVHVFNPHGDGEGNSYNTTETTQM